METHPSPTAKQGFLDYRAMRNPGAVDVPESGYVHCRQCGFVANSARDAKNIDGDGGSASSTSMLTDGGLENWTGNTLDSWAITGSTVTKETTRGFYRHYVDSAGSASAKLVRAGSDITISGTVSSPSGANGEALWLMAWVKCETNNVVRLRLRINGTDYYSAYNEAQVNWRQLSVRRDAISSISSMSVAILADNADGTAYVDDLLLQRAGSIPTEAVSAGCPQCGSFFYI